ncbi:sigma-70 family RNA polymerase sigma factor [Amycolatopsis sp. NPDC049159]|uniref:RNA polymerase sigma factor n=1 Tax=Amycolatopsis sp. NPDC049159 TaxID=3157210 RepID=UPI0033F327D3
MGEAGHEDLPPDRQLLADFRAGKPGAGDRLFRRHAAALRRVAAGWGRPPADRDELVAQAFTGVLAVIRAGGGPKDHLHPYAVATMRDLAARWSRERAEPAGAAGARPGDLVRSAFPTLPVRWRVVLWSIVAEGRTPADLAPVMGLSPNGVAELAGRARAGLRQAYREARQLPVPRTPACQEALRQLEIWLRGGRHDGCATTVAAHVAACASCRRAGCEELLEVSFPARQELR